MSAALMLGAVSGSWAQLGGVHNYMDSSYIPARRMAQQNEWRNNSKDQNFPSRPRDMWQVGVTAGLFMIDGDVPALPGWNAGINIRKAIGYVVSLRGSLTYGETKGLDYRQNRNYGNAPELSRYGNNFYVPNFKTQAFTPSIEALVSLNNIMFHSKQNKLNINVGVGYAPFIYKTMLNLFNANNQPYSYPTNAVNFGAKRKDIRKAINNILDDSYETPARVNDRSQNFDNGARGRYNFRHSWLTTVGAEYRLSSKISLGFDFKYLFTHDDYIDGALYTGGPAVQVLTSNPDNAIYTNLSLNFNLGSNKKRTAPLWWINPLDYVYGETNNPVHTKFPPQVLPDADDDGVTDQFDVEPNTPAGAPVDVRGKARDTDGDGVPDFRDKELITPTSCQPVDADGVGKCPCPDSTCFSGMMKTTVGSCGIGNLPSVRFAGTSTRLSNDAKAILASAADKMKTNPNCIVGIMSYGEADKRSQQMSWDKANVVRNYLVQSLGISADRLVFKYGQTGSSDTVDLMDVTGSETPNTVPARPEYRKTN